MKVINTECLNKDIMFPTTRAVYKSPPKRNFFQKIFRFLFTYKRWFEVMEDYTIWSPILATWIFVPVRFIYDGASVPKLLHSLFNPSGMLLLGSLPHDFGYTYAGLLLVDEITGVVHFKGFNKSELDNVFENLCAWESGFTGASKAAKGALTVAGRFAWNAHKKENNDLKTDFPEVFV